MTNSAYINLNRLLFRSCENTHILCLLPFTLCFIISRSLDSIVAFNAHLLHSCTNKCCFSKSHRLFEDVISLPRIITSVLRTLQWKPSRIVIGIWCLCRIKLEMIWAIEAVWFRRWVCQDVRFKGWRPNTLQFVLQDEELILPGCGNICCLVCVAEYYCASVLWQSEVLQLQCNFNTQQSSPLMSN